VIQKLYKALCNVIHVLYTVIQCYTHVIHMLCSVIQCYAYGNSATQRYIYGRHSCTHVCHVYNSVQYTVIHMSYSLIQYCTVLYNVIHCYTYVIHIRHRYTHALHYCAPVLHGYTLVIQYTLLINLLYIFIDLLYRCYTQLYTVINRYTHFHSDIHCTVKLC